MKYENLKTLEKHLEETPFEKLSPLYLIMGKNEFESGEASKLLLKHLLPNSNTQSKELSLSILDGAQVQDQELFDKLFSRSLFADMRLVWIQQADKLKKSAQEGLEKYFERPSPYLRLLLSAPGIAKNTLFYKAIDKAGVVVELAEIKPWEKERYLADWVSKRAAAERKVMAYPVCQRLVNTIGADDSLIAQEFEKLMCYCVDKKEISQQDVDAICTRQHSENVWQLCEAIFRRDAATSLRIGESLLLDGQALLPLLRVIRSQFQTDYQISILLAQGRHGGDIAQAFPQFKGMMLDRHIQQAKQFGSAAFNRGLIALDEAELKVKNSGMEEKMILELLLIQLTRSNR